MATQNMTLHQKILKIADMAGVLQKTKSGYSYRYVPEEDIQAKVTAGLQKYGIMLYSSIVPKTLNVTPISYEKYDKTLKGMKPVNEVIVSADMTYKWVNAENADEFVETTWAFVGQMEDAAQALGAGLTYANRYYLMKQLQLATTESDPDNYRTKQREADDYEATKAAKELDSKIQEVIDAGTTLISDGIAKESMIEAVASCNGGNGNPRSIETIEVCELILKTFKEMKKKKKGQ